MFLFVCFVLFVFFRSSTNIQNNLITTHNLIFLLLEEISFHEVFVTETGEKGFLAAQKILSNYRPQSLNLIPTSEIMMAIIIISAVCYVV